MELNFVDSDVREFARVFFSEILKRPYALDPNVMGQVTVRSGGRIDGNRALALARQALETTGNTIRLSDGVFRITPLSGGGGMDGGTTRTFTLNHIDPAAAQNALAGLMQGRTDIVATTGNSLTLRGDQETLQMVGSMVAAIDIDKFATASSGLFPLTNSTAKGGNTQPLTAEGGFLSGGETEDKMTVTADTGANKLIIRARAAEYKATMEALSRLDTPPPPPAAWHPPTRGHDSPEGAGTALRAPRA